MNLKTIQTFHNSTEANLWKTRLEAQGFLCFLYDEHLTSLYPGSNAVLAGGIKLKVRTEDVERVMNAFPGFFLSGTEAIVFCPKCQSNHVVIDPKLSYFSILIEAFKSFADLLFPRLVKQKYHCKNCGHQFKS